MLKLPKEKKKSEDLEPINYKKKKKCDYTTERYKRKIPSKEKSIDIVVEIWQTDSNSAKN